MELSQKQQEILEAPYNKIVVMASAASGKTALMTEKVRQLLRANVNPREIVVITFTNMAAEEMRQRLGADLKEGLFVGTIHSLANYFLRLGGINTNKILDEENFDELFDEIQKYPSCIKPIEYLVLDEGQDCDAQQFEFMFDMINPSSFFIVADIKQSIYQWKGSKPKLLLRLAREDDVHTFSLDENYRNGASILDFAQQLIYPTGLEDTSYAMRPVRGQVIKDNFTFQGILDYIKSDPQYGSWAVLVRTNQQLSDITMYLKRHQIPCDTFRQGDLTKDELAEKMKADTVKVLTVHSAKGLEWNNVVAVGMMYFSDEERNVCYVAATRARNKLIWMYAQNKRRKF